MRRNGQDEGKPNSSELTGSGYNWAWYSGSVGARRGPERHATTKIYPLKSRRNCAPSRNSIFVEGFITIPSNPLRPGHLLYLYYHNNNSQPFDSCCKGLDSVWIMRSLASPAPTLHDCQSRYGIPPSLLPAENSTTFRWP